MIRGVERAKLLKRELGDGPASIGRAIDRRIMEHDELSVAAEVDIKLKDISASFERALVGKERMLGRLSNATPMGDIQDPLSAREIITLSALICA